MLDINDLFSIEDEEKYIEPEKIFSSLIKDEQYSYLRDIQTEILNSWFVRRNKKDTILKMNTGAGKTLVGLLMLQSSLNEGVGPAIYVCPNLQLVDQVIEKAKEYGVKCVKFKNQSKIPPEFLDGEAILVTVFDKIFNGKSIFKKHQIDIGTILFDDAHSCIAKAREKFTIKISNRHKLYSELLTIFKDSLEKQDIGSTGSICSGDTSIIMEVPYWTWENNLSIIVEKLSKIAEKISSEDETEKNIIFNWPLLRSNLKNCNILVSGKCIEITPYCLPINQFAYFKNSKRRIFMSATLLDDSVLIKDFDIDIDSIKSPLISSKNYSIGERMIIIPTLIHESLKTTNLPSIFSDINQNKVVLVPSKYKGYIDKWTEAGAEILNTETISNRIKSLKNKKNDFVVLANRYDGIDLHGEQCRVLIMEGLSLNSTLYDRFLKDVRPNSKVVKILLSQQIEQGIGRSTRSSSDYSIVILTGTDLETFILSKENLKYLSAQTRRQIEIGKDFIKKLRDISEGNAKDALSAIMNASFSRNQNWIKFHNVELQKTKEEDMKRIPLELAIAERKAYDLANSNQYYDAAKVISDVINKFKNELDESDIGWYMQIEASYLHKVDKGESLIKQKRAHEFNSNILKCIEGINYKKILKKQNRQVKKIYENILEYSDGNAIIIKANEIIENLKFGNNSNKFEQAFKELGLFLGYIAQRPEKEFRNGLPDVLWKMTNNEYVITEAKNEVLDKREFIYKDEAAQITSGYLWFKDEYRNSSDNELIGHPILIHPSNKKDACAYPDEKVRVMTEFELNKLRNNLLDFSRVLAKEFDKEIDETFIGKQLIRYKLRDIDFIKNYTDKII